LMVLNPMNVGMSIFIGQLCAYQRLVVGDALL